MRKWRMLSLLALVAAALLVTSNQAMATNSWNGYHWYRTSTSTVLRITILDSVTSAWDANLSRANSDWNRSTVFENVISASDTSSTTRSSCPASSGRIRVCNYTYGQTGWRGLAQVSVTSARHIRWGTTKVNDSYSNGTYAKQHIMCQEVGHDFGLDHQFTNAGSCMDYAGIDDPAYVAPNSHDYSQLATSHNHGDSTFSTSVSTIATGTTVTSILWTD